MGFYMIKLLKHLRNNMKNQNKTWKNLLAIAIFLFFVVGIAMTFYDDKVGKGVQYLLTMILFIVALYRLNKNKLSFEGEKQTYLSLGFIFSVVGLSVQPVLWGFGIVLFVIGLFQKK